MLTCAGYINFVDYKKKNCLKLCVNQVAKHGLPLSKASQKRLNYAIYEYLAAQDIKDNYKACPLGPFFWCSCNSF